MITLQEITASNWYAICTLEVLPAQRAWVASNYHSLVEAAYGFPGELAHLSLVPLAIYAADVPVGFVMYNVAPERDRFCIMRLMVDGQHQGQGYGRAALQQLLALMRVHPQAKEVAISFQADNVRVGDLYRACGFVEVAADGVEVMLWQPLNPQPAAWTSLWNPAFTYRPE